MLLKKGRILILKSKYFLVGLFLMLVMFLVGCNGNGGSTPPITLNQSPTASFTATPTSGVAPLEVFFNGSSSSDSDGSIISYQWDFKDGATGSGQTINHTFSSTGSYNIRLTITDNEGATDSTTKTITVTETPSSSVIHSLSADQSTITEGESATLSWEVTNATSVSLDQEIGTVALSGSTSISPTSTTTYTIYPDCHQ